MPFDPKFKDTYKFGIKGAAQDIGAYAERIDEQLFTEGILDRIYNQINKADVIVADMTGQNSNVFYEVGYAHALNKIVVLLTQRADDIPFDLKHRPHIIYEGDIEKLREKLTQMLTWAINESAKREKESIQTKFEVSLSTIDIPEAVLPDEETVIEITTKRMLQPRFPITVFVRNSSSEASPMISHLYLFSSPNNELTTGRVVSVERMSTTYYEPFEPYKAKPFDAYDGLSNQFRLDTSIPALPAGAVEQLSLLFGYNNRIPTDIQSFRLRIHSFNSVHDFPFKIQLI